MESQRGEEPPQNVPVTASAEDDSRKKQEQAEPVLRAELQVPQSIIEQHEARQRQSDIREQERDTRDRRRLCVEAWALAVGIFGIVALIFTLREMREATKAAISAADAAMEQAKTAKATLRTTQRASVSLGLPDGKFIDFVVQGGALRVMLYFRNYGAMTARNTRIHLWPVIVPLGAPATVITFPPVPRGDQYPAEVGPDIPPGFQHTEYFTPSANFRETVDTGQVFVKLVGRLSYMDEFGRHCHTFSAFYKPEAQSFRLQATRNELCDGKPHEVLFCHYGAIQYEMERLDDTWRMECKEEGIRITKIK